MNTSLIAFTSKAMRFWKGKFDPIVESTRRTAVAIEEINASRGSDASVTSVSDSATSVQLLGTATTDTRFGGSVFNDSTAVLYLKSGTTASASDFTIKLLAGEYWEIPFGYVGRIDGIWASAAGGAARITEYV